MNIEKTDLTEIKLRMIILSIKNYIKENTNKEYSTIDPDNVLNIIDKLMAKYGIEKW